MVDGRLVSSLVHGRSRKAESKAQFVPSHVSARAGRERKGEFPGDYLQRAGQNPRPRSSQCQRSNSSTWGGIACLNSRSSNSGN